MSASNLNNPVIVEDPDMIADQKVTWDCVWFGSYPQAEVVESADAYTAIAQERLEAVELIEDAGLYKKLTDAQDNTWEGNDITLEGKDIAG